MRKIFVWTEVYCLKQCEAIIAVSEQIEKLLIDRGIAKSKITVINNGVIPIEYITPKKKSESLKICFVGRLEKVKGADVLLNALGKIAEYKWMCDLYGDGTELQALKDISKVNNISEKINFMGFHDNVRQFLHDYDVIVIPSRYEAFSLTILEAMNAKVFVICSDVGGMSTIIRNMQNGIKFPVEDADALAVILKKVISKEIKVDNIVNNAYIEFQQKYTADIMVDNTFDVLRRVGDKNG